MPETVKRLTNAFDERIETLAVMSLDTLWERMRGEFLNQWAVLSDQNLSADALEREMLAFLDGLSDKPVEDVARKSSAVAYNRGRDVEMRVAAVAAEVQYVVRSEILDEDTCPKCVILDATVYRIGTPEYEEFMPPALCEGGQRCRGFYIPVAEGLA